MKQYKRVMFTGDSVTDCGRGRPLGDGGGQLGDSYMARLYANAWARDPECAVRFLNTAISGFTSRQLLAVFDSDVLAYKPDVLFIMIGINDCWRENESPSTPEIHVSPEEYESNVDKMLEKTVAAGCEPILLSPFFCDLNKNEPMRARCDMCNASLKKLAKKYNIAYFDIQTEIDKYISRASAYILSGDRVHPKAICKALISDFIEKQPEYIKLFDK